MLIIRVKKMFNKDVLVLSVFIVSVVYLCYRTYIDTEMIGTPVITFEKLCKIAKTGDLVIFRWNLVDVGYRLFAKHSHVGMIVRKNDKLYLLEIHPNESKEQGIDDSGVHLYNLEKRLNEYNGDYYFTQSNITQQERQKLSDHIFQNLKKYKKKVKFDTNFRTVFVVNYFCNLLNITLPKKDTMFCSEFIGYILQKTNIYHHDKNLASINPGTFLEFQNKDGEQLFSPLYQIIISSC